MANVYGIDLGTTYSAIATLDNNGMPRVIENYDDSIPLLASVVYFPESGPPVVGKAAKGQVDVQPDKVVQFVKREIGKPDAQVHTFNGVQYDPITISSLILKRMKEYAQGQNHEVKDVVITCPAYFGTEERNATRQAGIIAGLNVLNIVNEPTAAALNYCCREFLENRKMMVYDLGGGTFDITLFDFSVNDAGQASIDVIKTGGDDRLGGIDWDSRLFDYICELYAEENGIERDEMKPELQCKLRALVEETKITLSAMIAKNSTINYEGDSTRIEVTRENFEERTRDLVERTMDFVRDLLSKAALTAEDIDVVLLVGGSTKMPMIKTAVEGLFPGKVRFEEPDLAVAKGAALAAAVEWNERIREQLDQMEEEGADPKIAVTKSSGEEAPGMTKEETMGLMINVPQVLAGEKVMTDKLSRSFGPGIFNEKDEYVIDNLLFVGDESPSEAMETYGTRVENQSLVEIHVFENISEDRINRFVTPCENERGDQQYTDPALKVKSIGKVVLELPPSTPLGSPIEVTFRCSTLGLEVRARNPATNESVESVIITSDNTKTREELATEIRRFSAVKTSGQM